MTALQGLGQKIAEWAVIAALVGVIGYLVGNSDAMRMRAEIDALRADVNRHEDARLKAEDRNRELQNGRRTFMNSAAGQLNLLCEQDRDCRSRYPALVVPE